MRGGGEGGGETGRIIGKDIEIENIVYERKFLGRRVASCKAVN